MMARSDYRQERWSLEDLFPALDAPQVGKALQDIDHLVSEIEAYRPRLSDALAADEFLALLGSYDRLMRLLSRLVGFAHLKFAEDTQDQQAQTVLAQMQQQLAEIDNRTLFVKLWWKQLEEAPAQRLLAASADFHYFLEALRLQRPHTLSEAEERVINLKDVNGPAALITLYDTITNRYTYRMQLDGRHEELTRGELQVHIRGADPQARQAAYRVLHETHARDAIVLGQVYQYRVRDWRSEGIDLRHYASPLAVRNLSNDIPGEVVEALLGVCQEHAPLFQRYFRLKARWLGVDRLRRYDLYAPVSSAAATRYNFDQAVTFVLDSFKQFDGGVADLAEKVFSSRHLDTEVRKGKRSGAFCASIEPDLIPWVLTSYNGTADDVSTLAHELGHAIHGLLASGHPALTADASLPLAETASTFGEMLLVDHLLHADPDPAVQRDLLFAQMDDAYATIGRQAYFALFERAAHDAVRQGASVDDLSQLYLENLSGQFGDSLELSDDFRHEWLSIPHIYHTPFYVYAYAFGQLLVLSLYEQYQRQGDAFKPRYLEILSAGGSDSPVRILERAGVAIRSPEFWGQGFGVLQRSLELLEAIPITVAP
jgi:oligoendopeptidase F